LKIGICISTFQRPKQLDELLSSIDHQIEIDDVELQVIIVDNDILGSAERVARKYMTDHKFSTTYFIESKRGIPQSRNRAFSLLNKSTDFVIFVDDDEVVDKDWISQFLILQKESNSDVLCGPVYLKYEVQPPKWLIQGGYLDHGNYSSVSSGQTLTYQHVRTGNLFVKYDCLKNMEGPFNESFALTGGEDTNLGYRLEAFGYKICWAKNAVTHEFIPENRMKLKYILLRHFRIANTEYDISIGSKGSLGLMKQFAQGCSRIVIGLLILPISCVFSLFRGWHLAVDQLKLITRGLGFVARSFGFRYNLYAMN
jgi:succinoglycan biosynthesis protein ExoM